MLLKLSIFHFIIPSICWNNKQKVTFILNLLVIFENLGSLTCLSNISVDLSYLC
jgi:hypothetical protein